MGLVGWSFIKLIIEFRPGAAAGPCSTAGIPLHICGTTEALLLLICAVFFLRREGLRQNTHVCRVQHLSSSHPAICGRFVLAPPRASSSGGTAGLRRISVCRQAVSDLRSQGGAGGSRREKAVMMHSPSKGPIRGLCRCCTDAPPIQTSGNHLHWSLHRSSSSSFPETPGRWA
jgi:hypothetical protein